MIICRILYFLLGISLLVTCFSAFRLTPSVRQWIERALSSTNLGITELASLSTNEALAAFSRYFGAAAVVGFGIFAFIGPHLNEQPRSALALLTFLLMYSALSISAWNKRRAEVLSHFLQEAKRDTVRYSKFFAIFAAVVLLVVGSVSAMVGDIALSSFGPLVLFLVAGTLSLAAAVVMANTLSLGIVFGPALAAVGYLWLVIYVARGAITVGSRRLVNFLILYGVFGTMYFTALGFPELRASLALPVLCR